jgi:hypothetical protein
MKSNLDLNSYNQIGVSPIVRLYAYKTKLILNIDIGLWIPSKVHFPTQ